jgi:hypothetical protein
MGLHSPKDLYWKASRVVRFPVMSIAKEQEIIRSPTFVIRLLRIVSRPARRSGLDVTQLAHEQVFIVDQDLVATREQTLVAGTREERS